jgi:hypothetical protein
MRNPLKFHWKEIHHLYIGIGLLCYGFYLSLNEYINIFTNTFFILGTYITVDDIVEHTITANTPLRVFTEKILNPSLIKIKNLLNK